MPFPREFSQLDAPHGLDLGVGLLRLMGNTVDGIDDLMLASKRIYNVGQASIKATAGKQ